MISVCLNCGLHDAGVTILKDNKIIAHIIEERLTNIKHNGSPVLSIEKIKDYVDEIDKIYYHHLMIRHFDPIPHIRFLYMFLSICAFSIMDVIVKWSVDYPIGQVLSYGQD